MDARTLLDTLEQEIDSQGAVIENKSDKRYFSTGRPELGLVQRRFYSRRSEHLPNRGGLIVMFAGSFPV